MPSRFQGRRRASRGLLREDRDVGDHDPRLEEEGELQPEAPSAAEVAQERPTPDLLSYHHGDEPLGIPAKRSQLRAESGHRATVARVQLLQRPESGGERRPALGRAIE
ncbi:MAG TPA: hypothetical protein VFI35_00120 [Actinomycetota bacterium]|nr:hypothetical protein [Actinomycetota bacterium]